MPDPGLVSVMLAPVVAAGVLVAVLRGRLVGAPLRGLWLIPPVVLGTAVAIRLQAGGHVDDEAVNRILAAAVLSSSLAFAWTNRTQSSRPVRAGVWLTAAGAAANALATLVYGFMPVLASSARWLGWDLTVGDHPNPQYVAVHGTQVPALVLGDVLPVPGLDSVVSLGDLLLVPGCTILLASVLARVFVPRADHPARDAREEVTA